MVRVPGITAGRPIATSRAAIMAPFDGFYGDGHGCLGSLYLVHGCLSEPVAVLGLAWTSKIDSLILWRRMFFNTSIQDCDVIKICFVTRQSPVFFKEPSSNSCTAIKTSAVAEYRALTDGHKTEFDNITILDRGVKNTLRRRIKESIFIHKDLQPKLNQDCGRDFPKIYSCLLATKTTAGTSATKQGEKLAVSMSGNGGIEKSHPCKLG